MSSGLGPLLQAASTVSIDTQQNLATRELYMMSPEKIRAQVVGRALDAPILRRLWSACNRAADECARDARHLVEHALGAGARTLEHAITVIGRLEPVQLRVWQRTHERLEQLTLGQLVAGPGQEQHRLRDLRKMRGACGRGL